MKYVAVKGCTLKLPEGSTGTAEITSPASMILKAAGKSVYVGNIAISISNYTVSGVISGGVGIGIISGSSSTSSSKNRALVLKGDNTTVVVTGVNPSGVPVTMNVMVEISDAGQNKVQSE